jgi:hypothetical protein
MTHRFKPFPPRLGYLKLPVTCRSDALAGLALYSASRPAALLVQRAASHFVRAFGVSALPGRSHAWSPPLEADVADALRARLETAVGPFDAVAAYKPRQRERASFCMLLRRRGRSLGFVKVRPDDERGGLAVERAALERVWRARPDTFRVLKPIAAGTVGGWHYLMTEALPPVVHQPPAAPPIDAIVASIRNALASLPRVHGAPAHWQPMHGDFTPWNLRDSAGTLYLFDWEDVGWGPPAADTVYYRATEAALRDSLPAPIDAPEAVRFWLERVLARPAADGVDRFRTGLLHALRALHPAAAAGLLPEPAPVAS